MSDLMWSSTPSKTFQERRHGTFTWKEDLNDPKWPWNVSSGQWIRFETGHVAIFNEDVLWQKAKVTLPFRRYSSTFVPRSSFRVTLLFPKVQNRNRLRGRHFQTIENIRMFVTDQWTLQKNEIFQYYFQEQDKFLRCIIPSKRTIFKQTLLFLIV